jgi:alpha-ketoglutarate-dependent taurine dioxygenase
VFKSGNTAGLGGGGRRIRAVGSGETEAGIRLLTFDHEELVGRGFAVPALAQVEPLARVGRVSLVSGTLAFYRERMPAAAATEAAQASTAHLQMSHSPNLNNCRLKRAETAGARRSAGEIEHPVVRTHVETGRKCLYVNRNCTVRFEDMTEQESAPLLGWLCQHAVRPEFTCRFRWRANSIAF